MLRLPIFLLLGTLTLSAGEVPDASGLWSLKPVRKPETPAVGITNWSKAPLDPFVLAKLEAAGLTPSPEADRRTLIRRLSFDLTGLPPSFEEVRDFERDPSSDAYQKLVDRLLASPAFGERWARHWLDIARYSDTKGYVFEESRDYPYAYSFRDWTIRAFNDDLPYDRFLLYQLAADRATASDADKQHLAAMGFLTVGRRFLNRQPDIIDDRIDVTFRGMLGLTVACARCHDHKYDPIPTADYYSLYGVFDSSEEPGELPLLGEPANTDETRAFEAELGKKQQAIDDYLAKRSREQSDAAFIERYLKTAQEGSGQGDQELKKLASSRNLLQRPTLDWRKRLKETDDGRNPVFAPWHAFAKLPPEGFAEAAGNAWETLKSGGITLHPALLEKIDASLPNSLDATAKLYGQLLAEPGDDTALKEAAAPSRIAPGRIYPLLETRGQQHVRRLRRDLAGVRTHHPGAPPRGMVMVDRASPKEPRILERGDPGRRGGRVPRQFLQLLKGSERKPFTDGSGRLEMAREITSKDNPLTARVWANRVWGHLLGSHLVDTPSDFGRRSETPSHPDLLDHLAWRCMKDDWSTKTLIRGIVLSATYRQSSIRSEAHAAADPENRLFGHANRRRVDFESLRDGMLSVAGQLDEQRFGRPVEISGKSYSKRRTIYGRVERQNLPAVFRTFDFASPDVHVPKRPETTVPQQALFMINGRFSQDQAMALAENADRNKAMKDEDRIRSLYRRVLSREPDADEIADALAFVGAAPSESTEGRWEYGHGHFDETAGQLHFEALPHFDGRRWQGGSHLPDDLIGWVSIHKSGGHPGNRDHAAIWRWTAPQDGRYQIRGTVELPSSNSDGVHATIFAGGAEKLGSWRVAPAQPTAVRLELVPLKRGMVLHFVIACGSGESHDSFTWNPGLRDLATGETWVASEGFRNTTAKPSSSLWEQLAQALLASNEFAFID